jgi:hypothetical protein
MPGRPEGRAKGHRQIGSSFCNWNALKSYSAAALLSSAIGWMLRKAIPHIDHADGDGELHQFLAREVLAHLLEILVLHRRGFRKPRQLLGKLLFRISYILDNYYLRSWERLSFHD